MTPLPIDGVLPELLAAVNASGAAILRAPTGAGKTTRVPPALADSCEGLVLMLEPRRVAARAAARRMAAEHGSPLGDRFGHHVRFDRKSGPRTRVLVVTPGVLLRMLHENTYLDGIAAIVFDEFHERGLEADLALGLVKLIRENVRPELKIVVMSATIDAGPASAFLGNAPVVTSEGRSFPVSIRYRPRRSDTPVSLAVANAIRDVLDETDGDVLAFLPGLREIRQTEEEIRSWERGRLGRVSDSIANYSEGSGSVAGEDARAPRIEILLLHGDLPPEQQDRALQKLDHRKVVLATNVAETSVTVDGVTGVIDSGLARQMEFEPSVGMDRLRLVPISRASADQRAGRAGRTQPGICVRLWDEIGHRARPEQTEPEIRRVDLCGAVLQLLAFGEDPMAFSWLDPPRPEAVEHSMRLLELLRFIPGSAAVSAATRTSSVIHDEVQELFRSDPDGLSRGRDGRTPRDLAWPRTLTELGRQAAELPVHPRLARLLLEGVRLGIPDRAAMAAALLSERDPFRREETPRPAAATSSDILDRVEALEEFERTKRPGNLHRGGTFAVLQVRDQLRRLIGSQSPPTAVGGLEEALFTAYPDRLARRRELGSPRALMLGGRGVKLAPSSGVTEAELFVCVDVDAAGVDSFVRMASAVERSWLPADRLTTRIETTFDEQSERLAARKRIRFDDLILEESHGHIADEDEAARVLAGAATERLDKVLPDADSDASRFRTRIRCLRSWLPDAGLPAFDAADLGELLVHLARGRRSLAELRGGPWLDLMKGQLTYQQLQLIEREAPDRLEVPSGSHIRIEYAEGRPPVLAARIQELFGLTETPRVGGGRVKVLLHLLAPNHRPQQVTDDLASFWANGYPQVRKELRGRYPKHAWPEDPLAAEAIRGPKRRS